MGGILLYPQSIANIGLVKTATAVYRVLGGLKEGETKTTLLHLAGHWYRAETPLRLIRPFPSWGI